jgi:murein DD-endopeptidase MepM/ murein hydrolase activator NlpD
VKKFRLRGRGDRRKKPFRFKTDAFAFERMLLRTAIYASLTVILFTGGRYYRHLAANAAELDNWRPSLQVLQGKLGGNRLRDGLRDSGSEEPEVKGVLKALRRVGGAGRIHRGDRYRIVRSADGALHHVTLNRGRKNIVVSRDEKDFKASVSEAPIRSVRRTVGGTIKGSLWLSLTRQGASAEIVQEFADTFQWTIDFLTEPREDDRYAVMWEERTTPDGRVWGREIVSGLYDGKRTGRQTAFLFEDEYYDEKGESLERMFLRAPLNYRRISSHFNRGRWHPILRKRRPHNGIDYAAPRGTPVVAVGSGRVTAVGRRGGFGKRIEIKHSSVYATLYGHLNAYKRGLRVGKRIRQGEVIGYVGSTGLASGPHLHFQISKHGRWVNFLRLKLPKAKPIPKGERARFDAIVSLSLPRLNAELEALSARAR